jgi:SAM-dependent methyltransferase
MAETTPGSFFLTHAPEARIRLGAAFPGREAETFARAEAALGRVRWQSDVDVAEWIVSDPFCGLVGLALLADEPLSLAGERIRAVFPELWGLGVPRDRTTYEHDRSTHAGRATPLLDRTMRSLVEAVTRAEGLSTTGLSLATAVLLFADVAKGGTPEQRAQWRARLGVDGTVHNEDSAVLLEDVESRVLAKAALSDDGRWPARAAALCAATGLVGMRLRGEIGRDAFAAFHGFLTHEPDGGRELARVWSVVNACETAAVREGLFTEALARAFADEERAIVQTSSPHALGRSPLAERIARMRGGALLTRETINEVEQALDRLGTSRDTLEARMARCRVWYAEAALGGLTLDATVRLLLLLTGAAIGAGVELHGAWHLDLLGVVSELRDHDGAPRRYPLRLLETVLEATTLDALHAGTLAGGPLISLPSTKGGEQALVVTFAKSEEAAALLSLLAIYEQKASAAFHATLKALCDLYGLRKDDFDRVANEASYLATMNAARSDKARMLDFVVPGTIVEVGPGGGVVLELLAARFPESRVVGLDASKAVVEAHEARARGRALGFSMVHGDAFELPSLFGAGELSTVVFCSVLHEIYSYVERGDPPARYRMETVLELVTAAFRALKPGGRIVVRDGVEPLDASCVLEFKNSTWREGFELFARSFEPRRITFETLADGRVRTRAPDAYEFLTTFTWGADAFPYEVRERRALASRADYVARMIAACNAAEPGRQAVEIEVPGDLATYLQPGYPANILPNVSLFDGEGVRELGLFDVQGVWVIEKR